MVMRSVTQWQIKACKIVRSKLCEKVIEPYNFERLTVNSKAVCLEDTTEELFS